MGLTSLLIKNGYLDHVEEPTSSAAGMENSGAVIV